MTPDNQARKIVLLPAFKRQHKRLIKTVQNQIKKTINLLIENPSKLPKDFKDKALENKALKRKFKGPVRSLRPDGNDDFRLAYSIKKKELWLIYIDTRPNFYRGLTRNF